MTISIAENAAVLAPWATLPSKQQQALLAVDPLKTLRVKNGWLIRGQKFAKGTIDQLEARRLVVERNIYGRERLALTEAGRLAAERLEKHRSGRG